MKDRLVKISDGLKAERAGLHKELHALLEEMAPYLQRERVIRDAIKEINASLYPIENDRADLQRACEMKNPAILAAIESALVAKYG